MVLDGSGWFWVVLGGFGWFRVLVTTVVGEVLHQQRQIFAIQFYFYDLFVTDSSV